MEAGSSDGEKKPPESGGGEPKVKRKMKTAAQLEVLENTYKVETYPSEALRADLSVQLGLTDRQLQMWFCHRRLKDRKAPPASASTSAKRPRKEDVSPVAAGTPAATSAGGAVVASFLPPPVAVKDEMLGLELGNNEHGSASGSGSGSSPYRYMEPQRRGGYRPRTGVALPRISGHVRYYEPPPQPVAELRAIAFVEAQLGEPLRDDGPALGMEFDPLPPGAFGAPIGAPEKPAGRSYEASIYEHSDAKSFKGPGRALHEYQFLPEQPTVRSDSYERSQSHYYGSPPDGPAAKTPPLAGGRSYMHNYEEVPVAYGISNHMPSLSLISQPGKTGGHGPSSAGECGSIGRKSPYMAVGLESPYNANPNTGLEDALIPSERRITQEDEVVRVERKRKSDDVKLAREMEANEKKMRKELERQDILRRKREELMRKEMERIDRERRKEEERLLREKQREEERYQKEQRREMERREKILLKESIRAEKMRQKEELRREREAVRQKAANDRAVARRLAKESMELIEDERLELMEIAASRKSFPSIVSLDSETLQNLDSYRDMLLVFPPKSVQLKKPFATQPWLDSEENVGNLLMVWRFLITFADVLGLWPFTLDEFVQAFHDYDPRLLGEINVTLLRTIIKDIEDGSRAPSTGLGVNQNNVANPGGGHAHIVEGAYSWGFDICSWQHNLNLLTWQEILRQFALSAGFGPKLKKRKVDQAYPRDDNEGDDGVNVISNLRTGAAVESAVAIMREKGYSNPRRSRHRLTPGTVKFAAFHVLSFEGSRGLNILDVADKIQNSGLRDLTTSKTPEASIAAALSRDTKIFERTAPSTYCVRSPYRKDPVDAEAILADAREKIRIFKSGFMEGVEEADVDGVEPDEVEKDDDSESDIADDPEVDDLGTVLAPNSDSKVPYDLNLCGPKDCLNDGIGNLCASNVDITPDRLGNMAEGLSTVNLQEETTNADNDDTGIDESCPGEPWVQGLTEGEYSNLSIEERLNALVFLIGVATEGNSIRVVLEERLEAATALKKQMWAESQLDKRRLIHDPNNDGNDTEQCVYAAERSRALMKSFIGHKAEELYVHRSLPLGQDRRRNRYWQFVASVSCNDPGAGRVFVEMHNGGGWRLIDCEEDFDALLASLDVRGVRESHLHALLRRLEPLFKESVRKNKLDTSANELSCSSVKTEGSEIPLNPESSSGTDSRSRTICASNSEIPEPSTSFHIESGKSSLEIKNALGRYNNFEDWIWRKCMSTSVLRATKYGKKRCTQLMDICDSCHDVYYYEDNHCPTCHKTFTAFDKSFNFTDHVAQCEETKASIERKLHRFDYPPARIRLLKVLLALVEACILPEGLQPSWSDTYRKLWGMKLHMSSSAEDLLQVVTLLEGATKRDFLSSNFQTTSELLASGNVVGCVVNDAFNFGTVTVLPWIPITTSAVALRLMDLDSAISYLPDQRETEKDREARHFIKLPSKYTGNMNSQEGEFDGSHGQHQQEVFSLDVETEHLGFSSTRGGRGGRGRGLNQGGKSQRRAPLSQDEPRLGQVGGWKGRSSRGKGVRKRGRRSVRSRQRPVKKTTPTVQTEPVEPLIFSTSPPGFSGRNVWNGPEESTRMQVDDNDDSNFEKSEYEEDDVRMSGDEYDDYAAIYNGKAPIDRGDFNMDDDEDEDDDEVVGDELDVNGGEYEQGDEDVRGYFNADSDEDDNGNGGENRDRPRDGDGDEDEISDSGSSDYSSD